MSLKASKLEYIEVEFSDTKAISLNDSLSDCTD